MSLALPIAVTLTALVFAVVTVVDIRRHPDWVFEEAGQPKLTWTVAVVLLSILCGVIGIGASIAYLAKVKPRLDEIERGAGPLPG